MSNFKNNKGMKIAFVGSDNGLDEIVKSVFTDGYEFNFFRNPMSFIKTFKNGGFSVILSERNLRPISGPELFQRINRISPDSLKILLSDSSGDSEATGASGFPLIFFNRSKPDFTAIRRQFQVIVHQYIPAKQATGQKGSESNSAPLIIGTSKILKEQMTYAQKISAGDAPVLITGETGTGKDLMARYIHMHSHRSAGPLQIVNCAAVNPGLFESAFFGHVKGAYTGAAGGNNGHFLQANNGTLVLDEFTEIELRSQVKLLRAIENQEIFPVGSQKVVRLNCRIIALTNRNVAALISAGKFRADLYHRLNQYHIELQPLSRRPGDIKALTLHFLGQSWYSLLPEWQKMIDSETFEALNAKRYPGNVRDLKNLILKILSFKSPANPRITIGDIQRIAGGRGPVGNKNQGFESESENLHEYLVRVERNRILEELRRNNYNITRTAEQLGLSRQNLQHRLKRLHVEAALR